MAPNLITVTGTLCLAAGVVPIAAAPSAAEVSSASWLFAAFSVFVYQTFDAVDGKQARRTGTSSALGNLLDHGCDSVAIVLISFLYAAATDQTFIQAVWSQISIQCCCFCAQ